MRLPIVLLVLLAGSAPATALATQEPSAPRVEIGGSGGLFVAPTDDGVLLFTGGPRLTVNVNDRVAIDLLGDFAGPTESSGLFGIYQLQARYVVKGLARERAIFLTAGMAGAFSYYRAPERRETRPDRSIVVRPAYTRTSVSRPMAFAVGVGAHRPIASRVALRMDAQVLGGPALAVRGSVGFSIPLGSGYVVP
jgi:hypothetical protein